MGGALTFFTFIIAIFHTNYIVGVERHFESILHQVWSQNISTKEVSLFLLLYILLICVRDEGTLC